MDATEDKMNAALLAIEELRHFCDGCEIGLIHSRHTYRQFSLILEQFDSEAETVRRRASMEKKCKRFDKKRKQAEEDF